MRRRIHASCGIVLVVAKKGMRMASTARYYHHGQSPAAWTGSILAAIGFIVAFIGFMLGPSWLVVAIGGGVVLLSGLVTLVMKAMGLGQP